jgi:predicted DNA-binding helix-hairpin-helix protein
LFGGYIHLKLVAGASPELSARAARYADRVSANIELPTEADLQKLAPGKTHRQVELAMSTVASGILEHAGGETSSRATTEDGTLIARQQHSFAPAGQSTQLIVGATPTSDREILALSSRLYRAHRLKRVYYSAFSPIPHEDPRLPPAPPPLVREHRLYQSDWLVRFYGFDAEELTSEQRPELDLEIDPKLAWAIAHRALFPVDVNRAPREQLLRVPGLGVRNVERILRVRRQRALKLDDLRRMRVPVRRVAPFVVTADPPSPFTRKLDALALKKVVTQLELFSP